MLQDRKHLIFDWFSSRGNLWIISREERTYTIYHCSKLPVARKGSNENASHSPIHIKSNKVLSISLSIFSQNSKGYQMYFHLTLHNVNYIDFLYIHTSGGGSKQTIWENHLNKWETKTQQYCILHTCNKWFASPFHTWHTEYPESKPEGSHQPQKQINSSKHYYKKENTKDFITKIQQQSSSVRKKICVLIYLFMFILNLQVREKFRTEITL